MVPGSGPMQSLLVGGRSDQLQFEYRGLRSNLQERFKGDNHRRLPCVILSFPCGSTSQGSQRKREAVGGGRPRVKDLSQMRMIKRQDKKKRERRKGTKRTKRRSALARRLRRGEKSQEGKVWRGGKGAKKRKKNKKKGTRAAVHGGIREFAIRATHGRHQKGARTEWTNFCKLTIHKYGPPQCMQSLQLYRDA